MPYPDGADRDVFPQLRMHGLFHRAPSQRARPSVLLAIPWQKRLAHGGRRAFESRRIEPSISARNGDPRTRTDSVDLTENPPVPDIGPGPALDPNDPNTPAAKRLVPPSYTLFHYPTPDDKFPDPTLGLGTTLHCSPSQCSVSG